MPAYDPQRTRNRPTPSADRPSPVDALLDAPVTTLPSGVEVEVTRGGETIVHTADADISVTPSGDDVIVATRDAVVEVLAEADEVIVDAAGEEILVDTTPRSAFEPSDRSAPIVRTSDDGRPKWIAIAGIAAVLGVLLVLIGRRRRS